MFKRPTSRAALLSALVVVVGIYAVHMAETRALVRDVTPVVEKRAADLVGGRSGRWEESITTNVTAWRTVPLLGNPRAKATASLSLKNAQGRAIEQTLDFFFVRENGAWTETGCKEQHSTADGGDASQHHVH